MIAYNPIWLRNLYIREQAQSAFQQNCLNNSEYECIRNNYPVHFYSTNLFIRIGLFILTCVILLFSFGLFALLFLDAINNTIGGLAIFFACISYGILEYMLLAKKHFRSGVDDALLWISAGCLFGGISYLADAGDLANCIIIFAIALYGSFRFGDRIMSLVLYFSLIGIAFFTCIKFGAAAKLLIPFLVLTISIIVYFLVTKILYREINRPYHKCLEIISIGALLSFYAASNYFVVTELSNALFESNLAVNESIALGWLFWLLTVIIPFFYIAWGAKKKDIVLIRVGLVLIAAIIFTVRNYYSFTSIEVTMTLVGIILLVFSKGLSRYLKNPRFGFTKEELTITGNKAHLQVESLLIAQTFSGPSLPNGGSKFGGGSFGGGGSSGDF